MRIGIISDIHGNLPEWVAAALAQTPVHYLICAGDTTSQQTLWELQSYAPLIAVMGNCDMRSQYIDDIPHVARPLIAGVRFQIVHRPEDIVWHEECDVVIHGHTHVPRDEMVDAKRVINPGSPTRPRGGSEASFAILSVDEETHTTGALSFVHPTHPAG